MTTPFKQRFRKYALWFGSIFIIMFVGRLIYGYVSPKGLDTGYEDYYSDFFENFESSSKNYASEKYVRSGTYKDVGNMANNALSQKYEKKATVKSKSNTFEKNVEEVKSTTKTYNGVIQYEQNTGNKGSREIHLMIGIAPDKFDSFYSWIMTVGKVRSTQTSKVDKTNEYRQLNAKRTSLEKTLASLNELKTRSGAISDYVELHDKILDIETQLQELGVELGNFDTENEFCTILFSLYESSGPKEVSLFYRVKVSLEWTIKNYGLLMAGFLAMSITVLILLIIIDKLRLMTKSSE